MPVHRASGVGKSGFEPPRRKEREENDWYLFVCRTDLETTLDIEEIAAMIVDAAIKVHRALGPGLLESAYQHCYAYELRKRGLRVQCEVLLPLEL